MSDDLTEEEFVWWYKVFKKYITDNGVISDDGYIQTKNVEEMLE